MSQLTQQLVDISGALGVVPGTAADAIRDALRAWAAVAIFNDPSQGVVPADELDPIIVDAVQNGAVQATAFKAAAITPRLDLQKLPFLDRQRNAAESLVSLFGPFTFSTIVARFSIYQSSKFRPVNQREGGGGGVPDTPGELWMLLPNDSTPDSADNLTWTLPAGTIWIRSRFLVANAPDFAGLRIAGGKLTFASNPSVHGILLPRPDNTWTLSLEPETPPPGNAGGNAADALALTLPATLEIHSNAPPAIHGDAVLSGFGSDLHFTPAGAVFLDVAQICFRLQSAETAWSIDGNASSLTQFSGSGSPANARFTIPISDIPPAQLGEAAHGGSLVVALPDELKSTFTGQAGAPFRWFVTTLTANAAWLDLDSTQPNSGARYDLGLWETSATELRFASQPLTRLHFSSERDGIETVGTFVGGLCVNKWDRPRRADGPPFDFKGTIESFGLVSTAVGPLLTFSAFAPASTDLAGFALENLYLIVRPLRAVFLVALLDSDRMLRRGSSQLQFDVNVAIPTLPDPYAANLGPVPDFNGTTDRALRVALTWTAGQPPALAAHLDRNVHFPEPRFGQLVDDDERAVYGAFKDHLGSQTEFLYLLDLSSREHLFGVALESPSDNKPDILDNRLSVPLNRIRLLMQPQVQWEPVRFVKGPESPVDEEVHSLLNFNGGPTLLGAKSTKQAAVLPGSLSDDILEAIRERSPAAALFSLPFGLRAMARLDFVPFFPQEPSPATNVVLLELPLSGLMTARQIHLLARNTKLFGEDTSRVMPGIMRQLPNLEGNAANVKSVLPEAMRLGIAKGFRGIPLHWAGLSGYGLSTFSEWRQDDGGGPDFTKVEFRVLNGRTALEVIQFRSILYECGARVIRTVVMERHSAGLVNRVDTGWVATEQGEFLRPVPFEKGAVKAFLNIRRIRETGAPIPLDGVASVQPVLFDADVDIDGAPRPVPIYDRPGYVQITPVVPFQPQPGQGPDALDLNAAQLKILFDKVHDIGSAVDCAARIAGTLDVQISSIVSAVAPDQNGALGFAVAVVGAPKLPRAGQWTVVRVDPNTHLTSAVDPRRGVPIVRQLAEPFFRFREPSDARRKNGLTEYALLMATDSSRVLFEQPTMDPLAPGKLSFERPPFVADPYSLVQSTGAFPRPNFALRVKETPFFQISEDNLWRISDKKFSIADDQLQPGDFLKGGGWNLKRGYEHPDLVLDVDSGAGVPFNVEAPLSNLNLDLPEPFGSIFAIKAKYKSVAGGLPILDKPDLVFAGALKELKETLDSLAALSGLEFPFDVSVKAGSGATPSFVVHMELLFRLGDGPDGRIDIGCGKFYGQIVVRGELEVSLTGVQRALLFLEFQGDVQQGIIPPLLYAGGLFRFSIELNETGSPTVQLSLGIVISIGGDLIPGLLAVEATLNEGYSLIPETLSPGVLLGIEARAKLLGGLVGFSFSVEAMARIMRKNLAVVTVFAQIRIVATVQIAIFLKEEIDFETHFQQDIPLAAVALVPPGTLTVLAAAVPV